MNVENVKHYSLSYFDSVLRITLPLPLPSGRTAMLSSAEAVISFLPIRYQGLILCGCQSNRWQTISATSQFGDSQLSDVKSVTGVSQFGDSHNLSTNDIFRPYISRVPTPRKIYCRK